MNYSPHIYFLCSLSVVGFMVLALLRMLDFYKVKPKQKITFIRISLGVVLFSPFVFIFSRLYPTPMLEIALSTPFINQKILPHPSATLFKDQISWSVYIIFLYGVGFGTMLLRIFFSYLSAKKQLRASTQVIIQGQSVFINHSIHSPLSFGLPKAKIYLPIDAEVKWTSKEIQMILSHENVHVERNDSLWKLLSLFIQAVLFFAPWMYYLHRKFELEMEIFCDLKTCQKTGAGIKEYGNLLLAMACAQPQNLIFNNMTDSTLKRRLLAMKSNTVNSRFLVVILSLIILLGGSTVIGMTSGIKEKNFFRIITKIIVDGNLVSSPEILAKENQRAAIIITNKNDNSGTEGLKLRLMAKNNVTNDAIEINYDIEYKNGTEEIRTNPQIIALPNQEAVINLSSDSKHTYKMIVLAKRQ